LIKAYEDAGFDNSSKPPFALQDYTVTIDELTDGHFNVTFSKETTSERRVLQFDPASGTVATPEPQSTAEARDGVAIPGVAAGAIIVAYDDVLKSQFKYFGTRLATGAYNLAYYPYAGGTYVAFIPLNEPPSNHSAQPAPTPTAKDGMRCLAGDCDSRIAYDVSVRNGQVKIREEPLI
jgi:hypothetical protein